MNNTEFINNIRKAVQSGELNIESIELYLTLSLIASVYTFIMVIVQLIKLHRDK